MYPSGSGQTNGQDYQGSTSNFNWGGLGSGLSGIFSGIGDLFGAHQLGNANYPNPATGAMPYLNQIGPGLMQYLNPYGMAGTNAMGTLQGQYQKLLGEGTPLAGQYNALMSNPGGVINQIGSSFQQSPGYNFQVQQAQGAANRAAAAGGMIGSPEEQQNIGSTVNNLANQDYYNYLGHALGQYDTGLSGAQGMYNAGLQGEQGINDMGFMANSDLAKGLMAALQSQAGLSYAGQADQNQMKGGQAGAQAGLQSNAIGSLGSGIGGLLGSFGSQIGSGISDLMSWL